MVVDKLTAAYITHFQDHYKVINLDVTCHSAIVSLMTFIDFFYRSQPLSFHKRLRHAQ